jgi:hypothetical protein
MIKVVCIFNKGGNNETLPCLTIGKIYDAEEGREYYWLTSDDNVTYNYDKKFFITLAEYRDNQINSILYDE